VIGRVRGELIWIKTDSGYTATMRVGPELASQLDLGQRTRVTVDQRGRPTTVTPLTPDTKSNSSRLVR
jgi:hypothetical protein